MDFKQTTNKWVCHEGGWVFMDLGEEGSRENMLKVVEGNDALHSLIGGETGEQIA